MNQDKLYTCLCCGFMVFHEVFSEFEICPVCGFQDSFGAIQKSNEPYYLNGEDFHSQQGVILEKIPSTIKEFSNNNIIYFRNPLWEKMPKSKAFYFPKWKYDEFKDKYGENKYFKEKVNA